MVFGKALNEAYLLESRYAIFPRIILTKKTYLRLKKTLTTREDQLMCWLTKDIDGFYYFDMLLAAKEEFESEESYPLFRESIEDLINDNLNKGDIKLNQKYE